MPFGRKWSHYFREEIIKRHPSHGIWEEMVTRGKTGVRTQCVVGFLAMHDSPMGGKGQSTTHENHRSCLHLILVTNCSRGEGRRSTQGLSNRLLWTVMSFYGCSSFDVKMQARGPSADASWNSPRFPKRPDDQHFRECMQTKPIAPKKSWCFCTSACS